ncbi:MAG: dienelactone hydrolase family protein [Methanotrichaceae archaeon]|nr:dienelactone hydrolase family protein [Methanotrichaceae archaeon]
MSKLVLYLLMIVLVAISGCAQMDKNEEDSAASQVRSESVNISSGNMTFPAYLVAPAAEGKWPGVVMIHSFNGLEPGYLTLADQFAGEGYVVIAPQWQNFSKTPGDETVGRLIENCSAFLKERADVNSDMMGLTGFCAGGRYTMLFLPQMNDTFNSGVAWYGFPYSGGFLNQSMPADSVSLLDDPMLIIHGTYDVPSKISDIYRYAEELNATGKYFEMKVYQGEPHGFMIKDGQLSESFAAGDAFWQMVSFFDRTLK